MSLSYGVLAGALMARGRPAVPGSSLTPTMVSVTKLLLLVFIQVPLSYAAPFLPGAIKALESDEDLPMAPDDTSLWAYLGIAMALVLAGGAFAGLTIALMGQDEIYLQVIATSGEGAEKKHAKRVLNLLKKGKHWVLVTLLLSNVITNETLPIVLDRSLGGGWPAVVGSTVLIVIFGEIAPQSVCVRYGLPIGAWMSPFVLALMWLMAPVAWPTAKLLDWLLGEDHGTVYKKAGLKTLVTLHKTLGTAPNERLNEDEVTIISAVLDLKDKPIGDIMTPMNDVFTMSADTVLDEKMMDTILSQGYSRIPIYAPEDSRNFIGMLLVKILITYDPEDCLRVRDFALATLPETAPHTSCLDIVNFFQEGKSHMVLVSDFPGENRGALGVVTLEDVIEELIGEEIIDESDVFVDVHRAIRRIQPAPRMKYNRGTSANATATTEAGEPESEVEASESESLLPKKPASVRKSSVNEQQRNDPRETTFLLRRRSSGGSSKDTRPVAVRSNTMDMRQHLRHLGPSNVASRPKTTKYTSVKIKPGVSTIPEGGVPSSDAVKSPQSLPVNTSTNSPDGGVGAGIVHDAALDAKDGVQAVASGYGTMSKSSSPIKVEPESKLDHEISTEGGKIDGIQTAAEASAQAEENAKAGGTVEHDAEEQSQPEESKKPESPKPQHSRPEKLVVPGGESRAPSADRRRGSQSSQSSSRSTLGELENRRPSRVRKPARSGSITENVIDVGGMKKMVLETTSSSDPEDGKGANGTGKDEEDDGDDNHAGGEDQANGASKKKKRKKRGGKKAREREAAKKNGESSPLLG